MKNLSRLTALLLALVMLLSITASATELSDFTKADYDNLVAEQLTPVELPALTATDSGFNFAVAGEVPENAELYVAYMGADATANIRTSILGLPELEEGMSEYAFDISIYENDTEWQPGTPVEVTITGIDTTEDSLVQVYHIPDAAQPAVATYSLRSTPAETAPVEFEEVEAIPGEGTVTFMADGFSIYYVVNGQNRNVNSYTMEKGEVKTFYTTRTGNSWKYVSGWSSTELSSGQEYIINGFKLKPDGTAIVVEALAGGSITLRYGSTWSYDNISISANGARAAIFDANGGSGGPAIVEAENGAVVLPAPDSDDIGISAPTGYRFAGWSTDSSGQGNTYSVGIERSVSNNSTVYYAIWYNPSESGTTNAYFHIRLDGNMPYEPSTNWSWNYTTSHGLSGKIKSPVSINNNHVAVNENIAVAPTVDEINKANVGVTIPAGKDVLWYVIKWDSHDDWHVDGILKDIDAHVVRYEPNGGSENVPDGWTYIPGKDTVTVDYSKIPVRTGYDFLGWDENQYATSPKYTQDGTDNSFLMPDRDVILYAIWKPANGIPYKVEHYLCDVNGNVIDGQAPVEETGYGTTGETVTAQPKDFAGYEFMEEKSAATRSGAVKPDGSLVLKLYYKELQATINYMAVGPEDATDFGRVDRDSETVNMVTTNNATGSTATPGNAFKFVGWYSDEACTQLVSSERTYVPTKTDDAVWVDGTTYYAKFDYNLTTLTIKKSGMTNDSTTWENAIFTVVVDGKTSYTVAIPTDESVTIADLPIGSSYTITEDSGWSWRYDQKTFKGTIDSDASKNIVEIENGDPDPRWLSDEGSKTNTYGEEVSDNDH